MRSARVCLGALLVLMIISINTEANISHPPESDHSTLRTRRTLPPRTTRYRVSSPQRPQIITQPATVKDRRLITATMTIKPPLIPQRLTEPNYFIVTLASTPHHKTVHPIAHATLTHNLTPKRPSPDVSLNRNTLHDSTHPHNKVSLQCVVCDGCLDHRDQLRHVRNCESANQKYCYTLSGVQQGGKYRTIRGCAAEWMKCPQPPHLAGSSAQGKQAGAHRANCITCQSSKCNLVSGAPGFGSSIAFIFLAVAIAARLA